MRHRDYTIFWAGGLTSNISAWMQQIAEGWLIYDLTGSAFLIGVNGLFHAVPFVLLSFYAGTVIDRVDRRRMLIWLSFGDFVIYLAIAILIAGGWIQLWHIYLSGALVGALGAFESPTRQSLIPRLVPREDLLTATSLHAIQRKGAQIIGPALGGLLVAAFGVAVSFFVRAAIFLVVIWTLYLLRIRYIASGRAKEAPLRAVIAGFKYVRSEPVIGVLLLTEATMSVFGSYYAMMVIFAREVFLTGPEGFGLLQSAAGLGSIIGSLTLASLGDIRKKGRFLLVAGTAYGVVVSLFAVTPWFGLALVFLAGAGMLDVMYGALRQTITQLLTREDMLGRVMSLQAISQRGLGNFGGFQAGALTSALGSVQLATVVGAGIVVAVLLATAAKVPAVRDFTDGGTPQPSPRPAAAPV